MGFGVSFDVGHLVDDFLGRDPEGDAADRAFEHNKELWRLQTEYNTPANQMQRLRQAGLNPNLAYGSVNTGNATSAPQAVGATSKQSGVANLVNLLGSIVQLQKVIGDGKREDKRIELEEQDRALDAIKANALFEHQKDALDLEKKKMLIDAALNNTRFANADRDYKLRREQFEWQKGSKQPSATGLANQIISNVIGKPVTDVATDTHNLLESAFFNLFDTYYGLPTRVIRKLKGIDGKNMDKVRY